MRTTATLVGAIIEVDPAIVLDPFIAAAEQAVDEIAKKDVLTDGQLAVIETWLAAHFYCMRDPRSVAETVGQVAVRYQSAVDLGFNSSQYGQMAIALDTTGTLKAMSTGKRPTKVLWLGSDDCDE